MSVNRHHLRTDQTRIGAHPQHLSKEPAESLLVALAKAGDGGVVGIVVGGDHAAADVFVASALDRRLDRSPLQYAWSSTATMTTGW